MVTTSFADLDTVLTQYADNALPTTLNGAQAVGATGLRLGTPFGFREGQTLVVDSGANQEAVTIGEGADPAADGLDDDVGGRYGGCDLDPAGQLHDGHDRRAERAHEQRPDRAPADRARHGRDPGGHLGQEPHRAGAGCAGART